jgi:hypothetical protein
MRFESSPKRSLEKDPSKTPIRLQNQRFTVANAANENKMEDSSPKAKRGKEGQKEGQEEEKGGEKKGRRRAGTVVGAREVQEQRGEGKGVKGNKKDSEKMVESKKDGLKSPASEVELQLEAERRRTALRAWMSVVKERTLLWGQTFESSLSKWVQVLQSVWIPHFGNSREQVFRKLEKEVWTVFFTIFTIFGIFGTILSALFLILFLYNFHCGNFPHY